MAPYEPRETGLEPGLGLPDDRADVVLGQADFAHPFPNRTDACGLVRPSDVVVDASVKPYRLYVVDAGNHRVLGYRIPPTERTKLPAADLVIGQADFDSSYRYETEAGPNRFCTPVAAAVDAAGNLYVADNEHHRVLEFDRPFETDTLADRVFGQHDRFDSSEPNGGGISARSLAHPGGVCVDPKTGDLWVADTGNNRVLGYGSPLTSDTTADRIIGQKDFTSAVQNAGGLSAASLYAPVGVAMAGDHLLVADFGNHRVLVYASPIHGDAIADQVLGQDGSFTRNERGCSPFRFEYPVAVAVAASRRGETRDRLLIADSRNHRLLMFEWPVRTRFAPIGLWGQGQNLHTDEPNSGGVGPASLSLPGGLAVAPDGTLWVADRDNHRVLGFADALRGNRQADRVIGQVDLAHATCNLTDGTSLAFPRDVAVDRSVTPNRLYVCDFENNRVLGYASTTDMGPQTLPALVIGQPDMFGSDLGAGRTGLCLPTAVAVDSAGSLFVADRENNRVLWFDRPFETDTSADRVFGQADFESIKPNNGGISASTLNRPEGVAVDDKGNLYVADTRNHRLLRYDRAVSSDTVADAVWGQSGTFASGQEYGGGGVRADTLSYPFGLDLDAAGHLACADTNNHRVLLFDTEGPDPFTAMAVFGQAGDLTGHWDNLGGCSRTSLSGPEGVRFWGTGLFVADTANCRVLFYPRWQEPLTGARYVYGQFGSFESNRQGMAITNARNLWFPSGIDADVQGNLYVADREQSRVLVFKRRG